MFFLTYFMRHSIILLLVVLNLQARAQNLLNNGSFEFGGFGVGFVAGGTGYQLISPPFSGSTNAGDFAFVTNPNTVASYFTSTGDHTSGTGKMMIVDGTTVGGQQLFWKAGNNGGGICNLIIGQTYTFRYWIRSISNSNFASIGVLFNNANSTLVSGSALAPQLAAGWQEVVYSFVPTKACVNIELYNNTTDAIGNDFAIDDLSVLAPPLPLSATHSFTQPNCSSTNSGLIAIYPKGGSAPFEFELSGNSLSSSITNTSGVFANLSGGIYKYTVTDKTGATFTQQNVEINTTSPLVVSPKDTSVCPEESVLLTVGGGSGSYVWTSSNSSENGFPSTSSSISVSPTMEKTTYTVSTVINNINLFTNGDFEKGNVGFQTDYTYYSPDNPSGAKGAYGIINNPKSWFNLFSDCPTIQGEIMVVDGSTFNQGTDVFWCQEVAVQPNKEYVFSYRITSVAPESPAIIQTLVNGIKLESPKKLTSTTCSWSTVSQTWNSGSNTTARFCLVDANYEGTGNDFAIDDVSLETKTCSNVVVVSIKPVPSSPKLIGNNLACLNSDPQPIEVQNPQGTINWYADEGLNSLIITGKAILPNTQQNSIYYATETINGCESEPTAFQLTLAPCEIVIPSAFTPNNDQENDFWELVNLDLSYPNNRVKIFNRWGNLLFESNAGKYSEKPWDGKYREKLLPVGSYFYVIDLTDDGSMKPINGTVSIILKH